MAKARPTKRSEITNSRKLTSGMGLLPESSDESRGAWSIPVVTGILGAGPAAEALGGLADARTMMLTAIMAKAR